MVRDGVRYEVRYGVRYEFQYGFRYVIATRVRDGACYRVRDGVRYILFGGPCAGILFTSQSSTWTPRVPGGGHA